MRVTWQLLLIKINLKLCSLGGKKVNFMSLDPVAEAKESIPRIPITEAVPEILPTVLKPVFVVFPSTPKPDTEPATIMEMQIVEEVQEDNTELPDTTL